MIVYRDWLKNHHSHWLAITTIHVDVPSYSYIDGPDTPTGTTDMRLTSMKVEPLAQDFCLTPFDRWNLSKEESWKRQGWRRGKDGKLHKTAFPHEAD